MMSARIRSPFTATQWQELEQQALIFKCMTSGIPIPLDLLNSIKSSLEFSISSRLFPQRPVGWACFEMGLGRKVDPEPGRCRRTDGKKWRCSKEAYPDSKYCEKHMHRGKNRSRKPVEVTSTAARTTNVSPSISSINRNLSMNSTTTTTPTTSSFSVATLSYSETSEAHSDLHPYHATTIYPSLYSHSSSRPPVCGLLPKNKTTHQLFLDSGSYSPADNDYGYFHSTGEGVDQRVFLPEASDTARILPESYQRLAMGSHKGHSITQLQSLADSAEQKQQQQEQPCLVLGTDFKSPEEVKSEDKAESKKPLLQFLGEWPPKNADTWLDLASSSRVPADA